MEKWTQRIFDMDKFEDKIKAFHDLLTSMNAEELVSHHKKYSSDTEMTLFEFLCDVEPSYYSAFDFDSERMQFVDISDFDNEAESDFAANDDYFSEAA